MKDAIAYARFALPIWAAWYEENQQFGWPRESIQQKALESARRATETNGKARSRRTSPTIAWPKETRSQRGTIVPVTDKQQLPIDTHRALLDLADVHLGAAKVLWVSSLATNIGGKPVRPVDIAEAFNMKTRQYHRVYRLGAKILGEWLLQCRR